MSLVVRKLVSAFAFATWIVQSLSFLNPKFQASSYLLWLYSLVGNPEDRFSHNEAHIHFEGDRISFELSCDKQNLTFVVISYEIY